MKITLIPPRLIDHAKQLLEDKEETLCVRVLQTIKGMMARDVDFGDKVRFCEVIYEIFHILNWGFRNQVSYDHRSYEHNLKNCV